MLRRWVIAVLGTLLAFVVFAWALTRLTPESVRHTLPTSGPVVVVGVPQAQWTQVDATATPGVHALMQVAGVGSLLPRATSSPTCTPDAWLTLGAGRGADAHCRTSAPTPRGAGAVIPDYAQLARANPSDTLGTLAAQAQRHGQCVAAVGPGAALGAADDQGRVDRYFSAVEPRALNACRVTLVDLGTSTGAAPANLEAALRPVFTHVPPEATVIITGLSDGTSDVAGARLLMTIGPGQQRGVLDSRSTEQTGLVTPGDITATALSHVSTAPVAGVAGSPLTVRPDDADAAELIEQRVSADAAIRRSQNLSTPFMIVTGGLTAGLLALGVWQWRRRGAPPGWLRPTTVALASLPVASWLAGLVPWWSGGPTTVWFALAVAAGVAMVTGLAFAGPWREWSAGPAVVVAAVTAAVIALDVVTGSSLQLIAPQGLQALLGGRFHGMGNAGFGFFAAATALLGGLIACRLVWWDDADELDRRLAAATVAVLALAAAVVDGAPFWGADLGGPPALLAAGAGTTLLILGVRLTWRRIALVVAGVLVFAAAAALADYARGPSARTHLGRFVEQIRTGEAGSVIAEKLGANASLLFSSPVSILVPILLVVATWAVVRPSSRVGQPVAWLWPQVPLLRETCVGLAVGLWIAFLINDSGVAVPATAAQIAVPLLTVIAVTAWSERASDEADAPTVAGSAPR